MNKTIARIIEEADTPAKVWALVASLTGDGNGYTAETYLTNVRAYAAIATKEAK